MELYSRHYSSAKSGKTKTDWMRYGINKPSENMVLLTTRADALFVWTVQKYRMDNLVGIECAVFRNEGNVLSSTLILEAEQLAIAKWTDARMFFTFVNPQKIKSTNAGYCFKCADWQPAGVSKGGLLLLTKAIK